MKKKFASDPDTVDANFVHDFFISVFQGFETKFITGVLEIKLKIALKIKISCSVSFETPPGLNKNIEK